MEHTKKMVLIEPHVLEKFHQQQQLQPDTISKLDDDMRTVINRKDIEDNEKWTLYNQILQKYLNILKNSRKPLKIAVIDEKEEDDMKNNARETEPTTDDSFRDILYAIPKKNVGKAMLLLRKLKESGVTWNESSGIVSFGGSTIMNSHITDLVNDLVKSRKSGVDPEGWEKFGDVLREINIPRVLISNPQRVHYINKKLKQSENYTKNEITTDRSKLEDLDLDSKPATLKSQRKVKQKTTRKRTDWSPYEM